MNPKIILFICKGNMHRSVVAEACCNKVLAEIGLNEEYRAISRGIQGTADLPATQHKNLQYYPIAWANNQPSLQNLEINISEIISTPVTLKDVNCASVIIVMSKHVLYGSEEIHNARLCVQFPMFLHKMHLFLELEGKQEGIPDCGIDGTEYQYRKVNEYICRVIRENIQMIISCINR